MTNIDGTLPVLSPVKPSTKRSVSVLHTDKPNTKRPLSVLHTGKPSNKRSVSVLRTNKPSTKRSETVFHTDKHETGRTLKGLLSSKSSAYDLLCALTSQRFNEPSPALFKYNSSLITSNSLGTWPRGILLMQSWAYPVYTLTKLGYHLRAIQ